MQYPFITLGMAWRASIGASANLISVTSFNEWGEGTQIEEAVPKATKNASFTYLSYEPEGPDFYLLETRKWIMKFVNSSSASLSSHRNQ